MPRAPTIEGLMRTPNAQRGEGFATRSGGAPGAAKACKQTTSQHAVAAAQLWQSNLPLPQVAPMLAYACMCVCVRACVFAHVYTCVSVYVCMCDVVLWSAVRCGVWLHSRCGHWVKPVCAPARGHGQHSEQAAPKRKTWKKRETGTGDCAQGLPRTPEDMMCEGTPRVPRGHGCADEE